MWVWWLLLATISVCLAEPNVTQWVIWMRRLRGNTKPHEDL
jgi:hypothetical protein